MLHIEFSIMIDIVTRQSFNQHACEAEKLCVGVVELPKITSVVWKTRFSSENPGFPGKKSIQGPLNIGNFDKACFFPGKSTSTPTPSKLLRPLEGGGGKQTYHAHLWLNQSVR